MAELKDDEMKGMVASAKLPEKAQAGIKALIDGSGGGSSGMLAGMWGMIHNLEKDQFAEVLEVLKE